MMLSGLRLDAFGAQVALDITGHDGNDASFITCSSQACVFRMPMLKHARRHIRALMGI